MLILTRKVGERINIGDDIVLTVLEVKGKQVRVGIEAPFDTAIYREEIYMRIQQANKEASVTAPEDLERVLAEERQGEEGSGYAN